MSSSLDPSLALTLLPHSPDLSRFHAAQLCPNNAVCEKCKTILLVGVTAHTRFHADVSTKQELPIRTKQKRKLEKKKEKKRGPKIICNTCGWTKQMIGKKKKPHMKEVASVQSKAKKQNVKASMQRNTVDMSQERSIAKPIEKVSMIDMISKKKPERFRFTR